MKTLNTYFFCVFTSILLSGCASSGPEYQSELTNAAMVTHGNDCNYIANNIGVMDQVIAECGGGNPYANAGGNRFNGVTGLATNAISMGLMRSGQISSVPYVSAVPGVLGMFSTPSYQNNYAQMQQAQEAQQQRYRLIQLFQQKGCVRIN